MENRKFPVLEMFCSIQGEGRWTGTPSIFVRLGGCNLRCVFGNSRCDTPYSSFELEKPQWDTVMSAADAFLKMHESHPTVNHLVITGGEPLLYKDALRDFITLVSNHGFWITVETNGTMPALDPWDDHEFAYYVDLWSVSPKLSTSVDKDCKYLTPEQRDIHDRQRINISNLASYFTSMNMARELNDRYGFRNEPNASVQLKFVYSGEESLKEIEAILEKIKIDYPNLVEDIDSYVMLMPEGTTNEQLENISQECAEVCIKKGWNFCDRLHIRIWGDKRGV